MLANASEAREYIDPNLAANFRMAALRGSMYELSTDIEADRLQPNLDERVGA